MTEAPVSKEAVFEDFFNTPKYKKALNELALKYPKKMSLEVDYKDLDEFSIELADELLERPHEVIKAAEKAVENMGILSVQGELLKPNVRFHSLPESNQVLIRDLNSSWINKMLSLEGVITKITTVKPKIRTAVFQCNSCERVYRIEQDEQNDVLSQPFQCACGKKSFTLLVEDSDFVDVQRAEIQEPLEYMRGGEQAKSITVRLSSDLTNKFVAGDRIEISGTLKLDTGKKKSSIYNIFIDANHIKKLEQEFEEIELSEEDENWIKETSKDPKIYEKIVASIAPSIYGHKEIKEAIALQLFSGTHGKIKPDKMKIRSDMHILLIGDPGTAKTQLLRYVKDLAPKGIYVSGKSSSGAGLTATAEKDDFAEGGWTLKAGALVLAAGGIALIDEFDKMGDEDRSSMHEAMESQTISVAKAGIVTTFRANASILAAANPKYGRYDPYDPPAEQFNIPPTILSRFDLIFPIRDVLNPQRDGEMADHILLTHKLAAEHAKNLTEEEKQSVLPVIDPERMRKYIAYARKNCNPILSEEAIEKIKRFYIDMRKLGEAQKSVPITARYLEAIVRLAEASAKVRLSDTVEIQDAERAIRLLQFSLREIGVDPETGQFDIDIIATGTPKSKADKIKTVRRIIKEISAEKGEASHAEVLEEAKAKGINPEDLEELLNTLKREGDIYSPKHGLYKPAEKRE